MAARTNFGMADTASKADEAKAKGNSAFKAGNYDEAVRALGTTALIRDTARDCVRAPSFALVYII